MVCCVTSAAAMRKPRNQPVRIMCYAALVVGLAFTPKGAFAEGNAASISPAASRSYQMTGNMALSPDTAVLVEKVLTGWLGH
jgi:hypothetical protein